MIGWQAVAGIHFQNVPQVETAKARLSMGRNFESLQLGMFRKCCGNVILFFHVQGSLAIFRGLCVAALTELKTECPKISIPLRNLRDLLS